MSRLSEVQVFGGPIAKARGVNVLVTLDTFHGQQRLDLREWAEYRPGDLDSQQPTKRGVNLRVSDLPALLAALQEAEAAAIAAEHLRPEDYRASGLPVPDALRPSAA